MTPKFKCGMRNVERGMELRFEGRHPLHRRMDSSIRIPNSKFQIRSGFTVVEMVLVLSLLVLFVGATVPAVRGLKNEQIAREPVKELSSMAKEVRLHAMKDRRPYQIAFTSRGFSATRYLSPYLQAGQLDEFLHKVQNDEVQRADIDTGVDPSVAADQKNAQINSSNNGQPQAPTPAPVFKEWTKSYTLPSNTHFSVQFWYETGVTPIEGDTVKLWVFQPSGIVTPVTVRMDRDTAHFEASFNALTADIVKESSETQ